LSIGEKESPKPSLPKRVGTAVRRLRTERKLTQHRLAEKIGTARSYLSRLENGLLAPTISTLEHVASALDIDIADLFLAARE
jgi:transcriptional regulator with XRE-family HTH domain